MNSIYANGKQYYINQDNCDLCCDEDGKVIYYNCKNDDDIDCTVAPVQRNSALVLPVPVSLTNSSVCSRLNKFIVGAWGLNLHPDDDKLVLFTRRRFSIKIKNNFSRIFSNMLKDRFVLSNGEVLRNCSWPLVSNELVPVATKSSEPIIEEYRKELDIVLPRVRVIDINEDDNCSVTRKVTDHEKDIIMARAMNFTRRRISYMARMAWKGITKIKGTISNVYNKTYADVNTGDTNDALKVRLRYIDDVSILNVRKKFSSNIKVKIHDKFSEMIENKYKLDDGTVIGRFTWSRVSKELFPIAKEEVKTIIDDEIKELEVIISKSRVVVDSEVVREITNEEKRIVLEKNIGFVCNALRSMCTRVWDDLVDPLRSKIPDARDSVVFADNSVSLIDGFKISLYYEDDRAILKIRRKFFRDIKGYISSKFSEMIDDGYKFDDGSTLGMCPWVKVSKKMIPIIMEKIKPIIGSERTEINRILLKSRAVFSKSDGVNVTKKLTSRERSTIVEEIIKCSYSHIVNNISRWWKKVIISMEERFSESCDSSLGIKLNKFVVNIWGVNIHPDDNRLILHVRKKFSIKIKCHLRKLFTDMIRDRSILPNGKVLCNCSWPIISGILLPIAKESVRVILEEEYKELDETFSKVRVVDVGKSGDFSHIRKVTDDEKNNLTVRARSFISRRLNESVRSSWIDVNRTTKSYLSKYMSEIFTKRYSGSSLMNKLRCTDSDNILNVRKEYLFKIKSVIYDKFSDIINNKHKLDDGTIAGMYSWFRIYRKLLPIAKEEVKHILEDGSKALELVISRSRVVVDYTNDSRELTSKEKAIILEDVMKLVYASLKSLCGRVWIDLVTSSDGGCGDASDSAAVVGSDEGLYSDVKDDVLKINFCCEDDLVIYSAKKRVSFKINKCIRSKFSNLIKNKHKFDDGSVIGVDSWKNVSGRLLPIAIEEIKPIIERERIEINKILLGSRAVFFKLDGTSITRKLTSQERHVALLTVMRSIYEIGLSNLSRLWNGVVKPPEDKSPETCGNFMFNDYTESKEFEYLEGHSLSVGIMELREMDKAELDNIRLEFVGKLGPVIDKVVNLLPLKTDMPLSISDDIMLDVAKSSYDCFKEEGFFIKLESLLSKAKVVDTFGNDRFILDEERKSVIQAFMDNISNDRDYLVKKRIKEFMEGSSPFGGNSPAVVYNNPNSS